MKKSPPRRAPRPTASVKLRKRLDAALGELTRTRLIRASNDGTSEYIFNHALVQDSAESTLLHGEHRRLHQKVARTLEALYPDRLDELAGPLARHYEYAGDEGKTLYYATRAGDQAANLYANAEAIEYYTLALHAAEQGGATREQLKHLYTRRGRALELSNRFDLAMENYLELERVARARADRSLELESLMLRATICAMASPVFDAERATQLADQALALARELGDRPADARVYWILLLLGRFTRQWNQAITMGEKALALARELNLRELTAFILNDLGGVYVGGGKIEQAPAALAEARALWQELGNLPLLADNLMMSATIAFLKGEYDQALSFTEQGAELSRAVASTYSYLSNQGVRVQVQVERGEFQSALILSKENIQVAETARIGSTAVPRVFLGWVLSLVGARARALELAEQARASLQEPMPLFFTSWAWAHLARIYVALGDLEAAEDALGHVPLEMEVQGLEPSILTGEIAAGELALARGEHAQAVERMEQFGSMLRQRGVRLALDESLLIKGQALVALGDRAAAEQALNQTLREAEPQQARRILWQIFAALGEIEAARGNLAQAAARRADSRQVIEYIAAHTPEEYRDSFLHLPRVQAVIATQAEREVGG